MDYKNFYRSNRTYLNYVDHRLVKIIKIIMDNKPNKILDIGCGDGLLLSNIKNVLPEADLYGIDVYDTKIKEIQIMASDITQGVPYKKNKFDCVVLGEVIEHLPDPDFILKEIRRVLKRNGILILSTPNLVSWANRILVPIGVQPLFTETSTEKNLGRFFSILGQGGKVQGHLKIFTHKSLEEILKKEKFQIENKYGVTFFFPFPISLVDRFFTNFISLSSGLLFVCKK